MNTNNKSSFSLCCFGILVATMASAVEPPSFNTGWITGRPEVLTYRSTAKQGDGLYQVSVSRTEAGIDLYVNIITPGFTKSVWGTMTRTCTSRSKSRIVDAESVTLTTTVPTVPTAAYCDADRPYNRVMDKTLSVLEPRGGFLADPASWPGRCR